MNTPTIKKKLPLKYIVPAILLLFLLVGGAVAMYLASKNQEIRQQASGGGTYSCHCEGTTKVCQNPSLPYAPDKWPNGCPAPASQPPASQPPASQPPSGGSGGGGAAPGCDNGVPIGGTACKSQGDSVMYKCGAGSTPGHSNWSPISCSSGQTCQGSSCGGSSSSAGSTCAANSDASYCANQPFGTKLNYSGPYLCVCKPRTGNNCWCDPNDSSLPVIGSGCPSGDVCVTGSTPPTGTVNDGTACKLNGTSGTCFKFSSGGGTSGSGSTCNGNQSGCDATNVGVCMGNPGYICEPNPACPGTYHRGNTPCDNNSSCSSHTSPQLCGADSNCTWTVTGAGSGSCGLKTNSVPTVGYTPLASNSTCHLTFDGTKVSDDCRGCPYGYTLQGGSSLGETAGTCNAYQLSCKTDADCSSTTKYCNGHWCVAPTVTNYYLGQSCTQASGCGGVVPGDCALTEVRSCSGSTYGACTSMPTVCNLSSTACATGYTPNGNYCISNSCGCSGNPLGRLVYQLNNPTSQWCDDYSAGSSKIASGMPVCTTTSTSGTCTSTTGRPNNCDCDNASQCLSNNCGVGGSVTHPICITPQSVTCGTIKQPSDCTGTTGCTWISQSGGFCTATSVTPVCINGGVSNCDATHQKTCVNGQWSACVLIASASTTCDGTGAQSCKGIVFGGSPAGVACTCTHTTNNSCDCVPNPGSNLGNGIGQITCRSSNSSVCPGTHSTNPNYDKMVGGSCTTVNGQLQCTNCDFYDACAPAPSTGSGGSCAGQVRLSAGEPSHGGFIGCNGAQNCFCGAPYNSVARGQAYTAADGNISCYADANNDSCGANAAAPISSPAPASTTPPASTPPGTSPAPAPVCLSISISSPNPKKGDVVQFTCGAVNGVNHYEFRVKQPDATIQNLTATSNVSQNFTISQSGGYEAQCRICTGADESTCQPYESL